MSTKRFGYELLIILLLILAAAGIWWWKDSQAADAAAEAERAHTEALAAETARSEEWAATLAASEALAVFRAFAAGIQPMVLSGDGETLDQAVGGLLELPSVDFVHIVGADGAILASSDRKMTTTGSLAAEDRWILETAEIREREGAEPGTREIAAPVVGAAGPRAYVWLGYDVAGLLETTRPNDG